MNDNTASETKKAAILIAAIVAVFGVLFFRIITGAAAKPAPPAVVKLDAPTPAPDASQAAATGPKTIVQLETSSKASIVNPFRPILSDSPAKLAAPKESETHSKPSQMLGTLPPIVPVVGPGVTSEAPRLSGVMTGSPAFGIFHVGTDDEVKKVGDTLSNGYVVKAINGQTAILVKGSSRLKISLSPAL